MNTPLFDNTNQLDFAMTKLGEAIDIAQKSRRERRPAPAGLIIRLRNVALMLDRYKKDRPK